MPKLAKDGKSHVVNVWVDISLYRELRFFGVNVTQVCRPCLVKALEKQKRLIASHLKKGNQ